MPTPTGPDCQNLSPAIRHPHKKPDNGEPAEHRTAHNKVIRGVRAPGR